jgi:hypothetical protein
MVVAAVNGGVAPSATDKEHVPAAMNDTTPAETVHTLVVLDVTVAGVVYEPTNVGV